MCEPGYQLGSDGLCKKIYTKFDQCASVSKVRPTRCAFCHEGYMNTYGQCLTEKEMQDFEELFEYNHFYKMTVANHNF